MPSYVIAGGEFTPFTYDELVKPLEQATEAHLATQEALDALSMQAGDIGSRIGDDAPEALAMYNAYEQSLRDATNELYNNGYGQKAARALSDARRRYQGDIGRISHAMEARNKRVEEYEKQVLADPSLITSGNPSIASLDNWLHDEDYGGWKQFSGYKLYDQSADIAKNFQREMRTNPEWRKILGGQYYESGDSYGVTAEEVNQAYTNLIAGVRSPANTKVGVLENMMIGVMDDSGIPEWKDRQAFVRGLGYIRDGAYSGIGETKYNRLRNEGYVTPYEKWKMTSNGTGQTSQLPSTFVPRVTTLDSKSSGYDKKQNKISKRFNKAFEDGPKVINLPNGKTKVVKNVEEATDLVYMNDARQEAWQDFGIDIGYRNNVINDTTQFGTVTDKNGVVSDLKYENGKIYVRPKESDEKWHLNHTLTDRLSGYLDEYNKSVSEMFSLNKGLGKITISPQDQRKMREEVGYYGIDMDGLREAIEASEYEGKEPAVFIADNTEENELMKKTVSSDISSHVAGVKGAKSGVDPLGIRLVDPDTHDIAAKPMRNYSEAFDMEDKTHIDFDSVQTYFVTPRSIVSGGIMANTSKGKTVFIPAKAVSSEMENYVNSFKKYYDVLTMPIYQPTKASKMTQEEQKQWREGIQALSELAGYDMTDLEDPNVAKEIAHNVDLQRELEQTLGEALRHNSPNGMTSISSYHSAVGRENVYPYKGKTSSKEID